VLEWNGEVLAQSITIARFIAREVGLAGRNNLECAQADEAVDALTDLMNAMGQAFFSKDEEKMKKYQTETLPNGLACLEKRLCSRGGQFLAGNSLTWADVLLYSFCSTLPSQEVMEKCPKMKDLSCRVGNLPNIKCWVEKRPKTDL